LNDIRCHSQDHGNTTQQEAWRTNDRQPTSSYCPLVHAIHRVQFCQDAIRSEWTVHYKLIPDEQHEIEEAIKEQVGNLISFIDVAFVVVHSLAHVRPHLFSLGFAYVL
jgi:hypothetical protein